MSTQDHTVVDTIAQAHDGTVTLIMAEHREWIDVRSMLADIEKKLSAYVAFVTNGGLAAQPSITSHRTIRIDLTCKHEPPASAQLLFEQALAFAASKKIDFTVSHFSDDGLPSKRIF